MPDFLDRFAQTNSKGEKEFSTVRSGLIVSLISIGTLMGALIAAPVADRIGRKYSISGWTWVIAIGFVIQISSETDWVQIMMGRWVAGLGVGALSLLVPMFQGETAPPWIRGAMVCCYQLFIVSDKILGMPSFYAPTICGEAVKDCTDIWLRRWVSSWLRASTTAL